MYIINTSEFNRAYNIKIVETSSCIPINPANSDYQRVLDDIIEQGADCFDGDIPAELQAAADAKQFEQQLAKYNTAVARLALYVLSEGRAEVKETIVIGTEAVLDENDMPTYDEEGNDITQDITEEAVAVTAIDPVEATVEQTTYDNEGVATVTSIENPLITKDNEERTEAQSIVDATPQEVIDAYNAGNGYIAS